MRMGCDGVWMGWIDGWMDGMDSGGYWGRWVGNQDEER